MLSQRQSHFPRQVTARPHTQGGQHHIGLELTPCGGDTGHRPHVAVDALDTFVHVYLNTLVLQTLAEKTGGILVQQVRQNQTPRGPNLYLNKTGMNTKQLKL
jgi:hypothetical protein